MYKYQHENEIAVTAAAEFNRAMRLARRHNRTLEDAPCNHLQSFEEVQQAQVSGDRIFRGIKQVPLKMIVGTVGRAHDFDRDFLPLQEHLRTRWENIMRAMLYDASLPPVQLYQVGDHYFVKDGNHRVSVARYLGMESIDAEVVEYAAGLQAETLDRARVTCEAHAHRAGILDRVALVINRAQAALMNHPAEAITGDL
jgi:hypothetical protein